MTRILRNRAPYHVNLVRRAEAASPSLPSRVNLRDASSTTKLQESMATTVNELYDINAIGWHPKLSLELVRTF